MAAVSAQEQSSVSESSSSKMEPNNLLIFDDNLQNIISKAKVLVVGAGGIGCELLKNLALTGFQDMEIIDLDTIEVSNLNRQFLFKRKHVGQPKAHVAKESVLRFAPTAKIVAHHASVTSPDFGVGFIGKFDIVLNALDNRAARSHVNRICLAAGIPLVESGSAGYNGQVELIFKGRTKCYECDPKAPQKTYPGCTIRNTPSQLIHCIVWAKYLFNQLFGERDPTDEDQDVSPDPTDSDAGGDTNNEGPRISTRDWAKDVGYSADKLFNKLFDEDIRYLLSLKRLWEKRRAPVPVKWEEATGSNGECSEPLPPNNSSSGFPGQEIWSLYKCAKVFSDSIEGLKSSLETSPEGYLVWDKDVKCQMNFVASAANIRAHIFGISKKSQFDIKAMAGNIVPAIATSNAMVAALVVLTALNVLRGKLEQCQTVYVRDFTTPVGYFIARERSLTQPNPQCTVCSEKPQVIIATDLTKMKCKEFENSVLKDKLNMIAPDLHLDSTGSVLISSEEGETEHNDGKTLSELGVRDGTILQADDFVQIYKLTIIVRQRELSREDPPFFVVSDISELRPESKKENGKEEGESSGAGNSKNMEDDSDDEVLLIIDDTSSDSKKRKLEEIAIPVKKRRTENKPDEGVVIIS